MSIQTLKMACANASDGHWAPLLPRQTTKGLVDSLRELIASVMSRITGAPPVQREIETVLHNLLLCADLGADDVTDPDTVSTQGQVPVRVIYDDPAKRYQIILNDKTLCARSIRDGSDTNLLEFGTDQSLPDLLAKIAGQLTPAYYWDADPGDAAALLCAQMQPRVWERMGPEARRCVDDQLVPAFFEKLDIGQRKLLCERILDESVSKTLDPASVFWAEEIPLDDRLTEANENGLAAAVDAIPPRDKVPADSLAEAKAFRTSCANSRWCEGDLAVARGGPATRPAQPDKSKVRFADAVTGPSLANAVTGISLRYARENLRRADIAARPDDNAQFRERL